ncbi:MAG: arsenic resistance operon repressor [Paenibacillus sp.]|jgi:hypothetical protein|nr:arsenic resistance operon repressor [Paenibacillus sp.]
MKIIDIYDPALCCSTGVCGTSVDPKLVQAAADIETLKKAGIHVNRYNLAQNLDAFAANSTIKALLAAEGTDILPVTLVDGEVRKQREYPTLSELHEWAQAGRVKVPAQRPAIRSRFWTGIPNNWSPWLSFSPDYRQMPSASFSLIHPTSLLFLIMAARLSLNLEGTVVRLNWLRLVTSFPPEIVISGTSTLWEGLSWCLIKSYILTYGILDKYCCCFSRIRSMPMPGMGCTLSSCSSMDLPSPITGNRLKAGGFT